MGKEICDQLAMSDMETGVVVNKPGVCHSLSSGIWYFFSMIGVGLGFRQHSISITCHICHQESHSGHLRNQANMSFALQILKLILWVLKG